MNAIEAIAIIHYDENGIADFLICGDERFRLFVVDERAPGDRVYEMTTRCTSEEIRAVLRDDPIGNCNDDRHAALSAVVLEAATGKPRLRAVDDEA